MVAGRKKLFVFFVAFFFADLLGDCTGKKTKDPTRSPTKSPTTTPSSTPTISLSPTTLPSTSPSLPPTANPTSSPSASPTASPTASPSHSPTQTPTNVPTLPPTLSIEELKALLAEAEEFTPTARPTKASASSLIETPKPPPTEDPKPPRTESPKPPLKEVLTSSPTEVPITKNEEVSTTSPTKLPPEKGDVRVILPVITFNVILSENEDVPFEKMESLFENFLDGVLKESSESYRLDFTRLDSGAIITILNETQSLGTEYRVQMDGVAHYSDEGLSKEALAQSLNVYFSFWGAADLEDYLDNTELKSAEVVSISIDGENVSFVSNIDDHDDQESEEKGFVENIYDNIFYDTEGELSKPVVISIYCSVIAVAVVIVLLVFRHRIGQRRLAQNLEIESNDTNLGVDFNGDEEKGSLKTSPTDVSKNTSRDPKLQTGSSGAIRGEEAPKTQSPNSTPKIRNSKKVRTTKTNDDKSESLAEMITKNQSWTESKEKSKTSWSQHSTSSVIKNASSIALQDPEGKVYESG